MRQFLHGSSWHAVVVNITGLDATELSSAIHDRLSCRVMSAYLDRIDARNDVLNAIVSLSVTNCWSSLRSAMTNSIESLVAGCTAFRMR